MKNLWDQGTINRTINRTERSRQTNRTFEDQDQGQHQNLVDSNKGVIFAG